MRAIAALLALGAVTLMGQDPPQSVNWREWIKQGVDPFRHARYADAIQPFRKAADANPKSPVPHLYLALAWQQQYVPGAVSDENADYARQAEAELHRALELDPANWSAVVLLGMLAFNERQPDAARMWSRKALDMQPRNANLWAMRGAVAFMQWIQEGKHSRALLDEAITDFEKAAALDPLHDSAMQYLSRLTRERGTPDEAARWQEKADDARSERLQAAIAGAVAQPLSAGDSDPILTQWTLMACGPPAPPPPPPPPPPRARMKNAPPPGTIAASASISWDRLPKDAEAPVRVATEVQARKLIHKVDPELEAGSPAHAPQRFVVVIGKDGRIVRQQFVFGSSWPVEGVEEALKQWVYEPTLVNGKPVEVVTEVRVEFKAAN